MQSGQTSADEDKKTKELLISSYYGFLHLHDALFYPPPPASNPTRVAPSIYSAAFLSEQGEGKGESNATSSTKCSFWS